MKFKTTSLTIRFILLAIFVFVVVAIFLFVRPFFTALISEEGAAEAAKNYAQAQYGEEVIIDEVFLHGGYLSYLVDGHFKDADHTSFRLLVDDDNGEVKDFEFSKSYANMKLRKQMAEFRGELEAEGYLTPKRMVSVYKNTYVSAYSCADARTCRIQEIQVALPIVNSETEEQAFSFLYEWQKKFPERIDSIFVGNGEGEGVSKCLRPESSYEDRSTQYSYHEFMQQGECVNTGDK
ncbi:hypothetical protein J7E73_32245 [Paenibacillus albidus]|uniref:hypothetical protein n=1 Tax=Paenibacillus albidus TaxID=2041023 RepID=UPI001BEA37BD|nr:hypothetical protein [Paenibacillus albidus]MBT2293683.1 hypothetical protein [Paenibacillus albidus]